MTWVISPATSVSSGVIGQEGRNRDRNRLHIALVDVDAHGGVAPRGDPRPLIVAAGRPAPS